MHMEPFKCCHGGTCIVMQFEEATLLTSFTARGADSGGLGLARLGEGRCRQTSKVWGGAYLSATCSYATHTFAGSRDYCFLMHVRFQCVKLFVSNVVLRVVIIVEEIMLLIL